MRPRIATLCALLLGGTTSTLPAQIAPGPATHRASSPAAVLGSPRASNLTPPTPFGESDAARLGQPTPIYRGVAPERDVLLGDDLPRSRPSRPAATLGPIGDIQPVSGISLSPDPSAPMSPEERYNWGMPEDPFVPRRRRAPDSFEGNRSRFGGGGGLNGDPIFAGGAGRRSVFESDHDFDSFISPVTNPFLAEDPRKLTELRPIFQYQTIPDENWLYRGGNINNFVLQGRLGLSENWSVVLHKLGVIVINPGAGSLTEGETGLTEIWLGPKWTFYKNCESGTLAAAGLIFQIPVGGDSVYQNTGDFGLVPYVSAAQKFWKTSWGEWTVMDTLGYSFGFGDERSDFLYNSLHLDFDVLNWGRIYPLIELNWFHYTSNGSARPFFGFEAADLGNVGAAVSGDNYLNLAIGARFKLSEAFQFGIATEFPLLEDDRLNNFRLGVDFIWRY